MARASRTGVRGLFRSADGSYQIDLRWRDKRTHEHRRYRERLSAGTKAATAKRRAQTILAEIQEGTFDPNREAPATLGPAFDRWLAHCETHGIKTVACRRTHGKAWRTFLGEQKVLASIVSFDVERFKAALRARKRSAATVNRHVSTLKTFVAWAAREGLMERGAAVELRELKGLREPEGRVRYLSPEEEATVAAHLSGWLRPIALACKLTGARLGEITSLRWRDVERSAEVVRFTRTKTNRTREVAIVPARRRVRRPTRWRARGVRLRGPASSVERQWTAPGQANRGTAPPGRSVEGVAQVREGARLERLSRA